MIGAPVLEFFQQSSIVPHFEEFFLGVHEYSGVLVQKEFIVDPDYDSKLFSTRVIKRNQRAKASVLILHDYSDHSTRYLRTAMKLAKEDFDVALFDFRGFGYSSGVRMMTSLQHLQQDVISVSFRIQKGQPLLIVGCGLGGGVALTMLLSNPDYKIAGIVLLNPWIDFSVDYPITRFSKYLIRRLPSVLDVGLLVRVFERLFASSHAHQEP